MKFTFVGNNYPYRAYNYATGEHGEPYDPAKPVNNSKQYRFKRVASGITRFYLVSLCSFT